MKDNQTQNLQATADTAEAEEVSNAATELGKFKDVKALMDAYQALEAEFTRRSQRLKELEASKEAAASAQATNAPLPSQRATEEGGAKTLSNEVRNAVIEEYLNGVRANRGVPFVTGGGAVAATRQTPSTIREAGALARNFFDNKEEN